MVSAIKSVVIWILIAALVVVWVPLLGIVWLFDRDPAKYHTGRMFRRLGKWMTRVNPGWKIELSGNTRLDDRKPYIVVSNHLSNADIPVISNLPWEMKWIAKKELFDLPFVGWMMKMAGDIPVDRDDPNRHFSTMKKAVFYLRNNCSVMFFPEGTRSRTGKLGRFNSGAFYLAVRQQVPIVPMVIDGTQNSLPKQSWKFGEAPHIKLKVFDPIAVADLAKEDVDELMRQIRSLMLDQLSEWRDEKPAAIDAAAS